MKLTGKRSAGNPHATFDEAEAGNVLKTLSGAPVFDPTDEGELEIEHEATTPVLYSTVKPFSFVGVINFVMSVFCFSSMRGNVLIALFKVESICMK